MRVFTVVQKLFVALLILQSLDNEGNFKKAEINTTAFNSGFTDSILAAKIVTEPLVYWDLAV